MREILHEAVRAETAGAWRRLAADKVALAGVRLLALLLLLALLAPAIASDRPFLLIVPPEAATGGFGALPAGVSFPWFSALFDEHVYESGVDLFFNGLLAVFPLFLLIVLWRRSWRAAGRAALGAALAAALLAVALAHGQPARDYAGQVEELRRAGHEVTALFAPLCCSAAGTDVLAAYQGPSARHLLGTDPAGRDVLARLLFGARVSLSIGLVAVSVYLAIGVLLGALAGYLRGWTDALVMRLVEVVACFPSFLLVLTLIALVRERSIFHVMLVIGLTGWPTVARLVRAEFLRLADLDFAVAARALGLPRGRIVFRHLLPNALAPVLVTAAFGVAGAILVESGLSFLNLGDSSVASWGQVLRAGRETGQLHLILAPGLLIFATVTMMNVVAEGLRDAFDPRLR
ncbi:MAG: ABC transporter permease [Planctomycetes bacterium]|nr:ABC transporter permease [Planctomycetota bacterium]